MAMFPFVILVFLVITPRVGRGSTITLSDAVPDGFLLAL